MGRIGTWLLAVTVALACWPAWAIDYEPLTMDDGTRLIVVHGEFQSTDKPSNLLALATRHQATHVTFDSPGGNLWSALEHGRAIRSLGIRTFQYRPFECASACAFAFLGGVERWAVEGAIGVHRSSLDRASPLSRDVAVESLQQLTADVLVYLREMEVDTEFLELAMRYDSRDMRHLYSDEMERMGVITTTRPFEGVPLISGEVRIPTVDPLFHGFLVDCQGSSELEDYLSRLAAHRYDICPLGPTPGTPPSDSGQGLLGSLFTGEPRAEQQCPAADQEFNVRPPAGRNWKVVVHQTHDQYSEMHIQIEGIFRGLRVDRLYFFPGIDNGINVRGLAFTESMEAVRAAIGHQVADAHMSSEAMDQFQEFVIGLHQSDETGSPILSCDISN